MIWPIGWQFPRGIDTKNLRQHFDFVTIPPKDQGVYTIRHEVRRDKIEAAELQKGERYTVSLTDKCLGTRWWAFASLEELEGTRFVGWRPETENAAKDENDIEDVSDEERARRQERDNTPWTMGEEPRMLAMVPELGEVEFAIT